MADLSKRLMTVGMVELALKDYLKNAPQESDGFLEGLDVTHEAAADLFKDFMMYLEQCDELYMTKFSIVVDES